MALNPKWCRRKETSRERPLLSRWESFIGVQQLSTSGTAFSVLAGEGVWRNDISTADLKEHLPRKTGGRKIYWGWGWRPGWLWSLGIERAQHTQQKGAGDLSLE